MNGARVLRIAFIWRTLRRAVRPDPLSIAGPNFGFDWGGGNRARSAYCRTADRKRPTPITHTRVALPPARGRLTLPHREKEISIINANQRASNGPIQRLPS